MKKMQETILKFITSKSDYESMQYANKVVLIIIMPYLLAAAVINMIVFLLWGDIDFANTVINSSILLLFIAVFYTADRLVKSERLKYNAYCVFFSALLIFIVLRYYPNIGPAVWTITFTVVVISLLRNNKRMITVISLTVFGLGVYVWAGNLQYTGGVQYYIIQFVAFAFLFIVGAGVLEINIERHKKLSHFLNQSEMLRRISSDFISVNADNLDDKVNGMLELSSKYYNVEKAVIFLVSEDQRSFQYAYEWCADIKDSDIDEVSDFEVASRPEWVDQMENRTVWIMPNVDELDDSNAPGKDALKELDIKAMISAPIVMGDRMLGILFYESLKNDIKWEDEHVRLLVMLTNLLAEAFNKVETEKEINHMAYYDTLTGLPNRFLFNIRLEEAIESARENKTKLAVMYIDLDSFKAVNDTIGHEGGDEMLRLIGKRLKLKMGEQGFVGRLSGDEFIILIPDISETESIKEFVDHVMTVFFMHMKINDQEFFVTASAGVAVYPYDGPDSSTLRKNADLAMYAAKEMGKNQAAFCTPRLMDEIEKKVRMTSLLHRAQERNELTVYYQPLIDLATKEIVGVEALLRWMQPELGAVSPGIFIPLAEQSGLIFPIGKWVLNEACRQNKTWQDAGLKPLRMAVNLSIEQFRREDIVEMIKEALDESGLNPSYLELEITESVAIKETGYISGILNAIKGLGVSISIDDFGTEYSSLARIKRLPIDRIKMAMEFVHGISVSEKDEALAKIIINLAGNLGLKVIAEGVETETQLSFLEKSLCDEVQGYYFYKPMPAEEIEKILRGMTSE